jgi:hypothetical protein
VVQIPQIIRGRPKRVPTRMPYHPMNFISCCRKLFMQMLIQWLVQIYHTSSSCSSIPVAISIILAAPPIWSGKTASKPLSKPPISSPSPKYLVRNTQACS